ncbi:MAG: DUF1330 domain-containing protein, partial [Salinisphaera sp.]|nr:DUF1330 domain-containing protein [Salinisphaera sp.]
MSAYIIAEVKVHDAQLYAEYGSQVQATLDKFGGRFVVRGGQTALLEGDWNPPRVVVLEFASAEDARAWWSSEHYAGPKALRQRAADVVTAELLPVAARQGQADHRLGDHPGRRDDGRVGPL